MWDYLFDPNSNNPLEQRVCKLNYLHTGRLNASHRDPTLHCVRWRHALCEALVTPLHRVEAALLYTAWEAACPLQRSTTVKFLESPTLALQGPMRLFAPVGWAGPLRFCAIGGIYIVEHHPHTRLSSGHGSDTN